MLNSRVSSVADGVVTVVNKANEATEIPYGACVWATGVAMNPLIKTLQEKLPGQNHFRCARCWQGNGRVRSSCRGRTTSGARADWGRGPA